jgi:alpha-L-rhamnosidase
MKAINLKAEHMNNPIGIDKTAPFLSWTCEDGLHQNAYQIIATVKGENIWDSGKVETDAMHCSFGGRVVSRDLVEWKVQLWDEVGQEGSWSEAAWFELGISDASQWQAEWINPELTRVIEENYDCSDAINKLAKAAWEGGKKKEPYAPHQPASYLRKHFNAPVGEKKRLYITCHGIYKAWLNGKLVGDFVLGPGCGTYNKRLSYQTYDVTDLVYEGENELLVALGDGWYRSCTGVDGDRNLFGTEISLLCQLMVDDKVVCVSDESWEASQKGPIRQNDMQQGEVYDARLEEITDWHPVKLEQVGYETLTGTNTVPIVENEAFVGHIITTPNGEKVIDFGQNLAGYVEFKVKAQAGQRIYLMHGEALDENGNFTNENFQDRKRHKEGGVHQQIEYLCREGDNHYKASFTIMGFQYVKIETEVELDSAEFIAHAVYSKMEELGSFSCSNESVNQLVKNSIWSQKGNFCDIPTDCPTRERAGWTGDAGVFVDAGLYLMDCYPVFDKWLGDCRHMQYADGKLANIAPINGHPSFFTKMLCSSVGWGDASILVPYALYKRYGNLRILQDNYEMMKRWYTFLEKRAAKVKLKERFQRNPYKKYTVTSGMDYGEWCEPGVDMRQAMSNPKKSVGTAYLVYSGRLLSEIAEILGHEADSKHFEEVSELAKKAYHLSFTENGRINSERQCEYVRALKFGLLSVEESKVAASDLNKLVIKNNYHLNTGFLSTPFLCEMLVNYGYVDTATKLLLQDTAPSWLYEVKRGANTIWETWDGINEEGKVSASLNHYSYGSISGWFFKGICGIQLEQQNLTLKPFPLPELGHAKAIYESPVGHIESGWYYENGTVIYEFVIPANVKTRVELMDGRNIMLDAGIHRL